MSKSTPPRLTNPHMTSVHNLGHPNSPPPRTGWGQSAHSRAGEPALPATVVAVAATPHVPNAPGAASLAPGAASDLLVTWAAPAVDGLHGAATGYALRSSPAGANVWTVVASVTSPYDLSGLAAGAAFDVQVQSSNAYGVSGWSPTSTLSTASAGPFAPNAPAIAGVAPPPDGSNSKLIVTWAAPAADGTHGAATGYNLRSSPSGTGSWTTVSSVSSPYTLTGLGGGSAIDVEVQATNAAASPGAWSTIVTGSTWGVTVAPGGWTAAATQVHGASVAPSGGVQIFAAPAPTTVTGVAFAWSASNSVMPSTGLIAAGGDGQTNGWGQWFNAPAAAGTYYLWTLAQGSGGITVGALVTSAVTVT